MKRIDAIVDYISQETGFSREMLLSKRKTRPVVRARQLIYHLVYENCPELSLSEIGLLFERDRTTIGHALWVMQNELRTSGKLKFLAAGARKSIEGIEAEGHRAFPSTLRRALTRVRDLEKENQILKGRA
jgi:hypothetical protein